MPTYKNPANEILTLIATARTDSVVRAVIGLNVDEITPEEVLLLALDAGDQTFDLDKVEVYSSISAFRCLRHRAEGVLVFAEGEAREIATKLSSSAGLIAYILEGVSAKIKSPEQNMMAEALNGLEYYTV